jgi:putative PIN family toxin of toxin-antitoxin system
MGEQTRIVVDTNVLISRLLMPASVPGRAVRRAVDEGQLLMSEASFMELADVLGRPKFNPYVSVEDRQGFIMRLGGIVEMVEILHRIQACRDPKDDALLEVAVNGQASLLITGDKDLLALAPYRGIRIVTPAAYLQLR